jgi:hypothetical protein
VTAADLLRLVLRDAIARVGRIADVIADEEAGPALVLAEQLEHEHNLRWQFARIETERQRAA